MKPGAESKSLIEAPLPHELVGSAYDYGVVEPEVMLTTITVIEDEIARLQAIINFLSIQKEQLLKQAVRDRIEKDGLAYLVETIGKLERNPIKDIEHFKTTFPDGYARIRENQSFALEQKKKMIDHDIKNIDTSPIPLGDADRVLGKDVVTAFVGTKPQTITYEVRKR